MWLYQRASTPFLGNLWPHFLVSIFHSYICIYFHQTGKIIWLLRVHTDHRDHTVLPSAVSHLRLVPVEAGVFVVTDCSLVATMLRQFTSLVENLISLQFTACHLLQDCTHGVSHHLPGLHTHTHTHVTQPYTQMHKHSEHSVTPRCSGPCSVMIWSIIFSCQSSLSLRTWRWALISFNSRLASVMSLEYISFLFKMARGTSGLGVRSGSTIGFRVMGGTGGLLALWLPWNCTTFMWARVCGQEEGEHVMEQWPEGRVTPIIRTPSSHLVPKLLHVAGVGVTLHDLELLHQSLFGQILLRQKMKTCHKLKSI